MCIIWKILRWGKKSILNRIKRKSSGIIELGELVRILTTGKFFSGIFILLLLTVFRMINVYSYCIDIHVCYMIYTFILCWFAYFSLGGYANITSKLTTSNNLIILFHSISRTSSSSLFIPFTFFWSQCRNES